MKLRVGSRGEIIFWGFSTSAFGRDLGSKTKIHDFVALFDLQDDLLRRTTDLVWASESVYWLWGSVPERSYHSYCSLIPSCRSWSLDEISKIKKLHQVGGWLERCGWSVAIQNRSTIHKKHFWLLRRLVARSQLCVYIGSKFIQKTSIFFTSSQDLDQMLTWKTPKK